ncbi:hypothetical protein ACFS5L_37515 [Streptomyces phyllanthi]|uniref:Uncharacterized protein n=1 Tax=Streptomyces phyllanthi TaxID=1803180 RepID=A0A5N8W5J2_9ACTN|nr:hypothetical protein [Streptomyces phyllanthi]MPY42753.1 hypothetical protein [Streptomyces phyllanthi]
MSDPGEGDSAVLFRSELTFRVWRYGVGHSQLLIRTPPGAADDTRVEILFEDVDALQLVTRYEGIEIYSPCEEESQRIFEASGAPGKWRPHRVIVGLRSASGTGYVQCGKASAVRCSGPAGPAGPEGDDETREVLWSTTATSPRAAATGG